MRRAFDGLVWTAHNSRVPCVGVARAAHAEEASWEQTAGAMGEGGVVSRVWKHIK